MTNSKFAYHIKNPHFKGDYIYPLSQLEEVYPSLYKKEIKKYEGREKHPETKIDLLSVKWKDCINLTTLNPIKIFQMEDLLGIKNVRDVDIFRFDIKDLSDYDMCLYDDNKSPKNKDAYKKVSAYSYKETQFIPIDTVRYFLECKKKGESPLIFGGVIHLMVADEIPIDKAEIIKFKSSVR